MAGPSSNLTVACRISCSIPQDQLLLQVKDYSERGIPLVVEGWHRMHDFSALFQLGHFSNNGNLSFLCISLASTHFSAFS